MPLEQSQGLSLKKEGVANEIATSIVIISTNRVFVNPQFFKNSRVGLKHRKEKYMAKKNYSKKAGTRYSAAERKSYKKGFLQDCLRRRRKSRRLINLLLKKNLCWI